MMFAHVNGKIVFNSNRAYPLLRIKRGYALTFFTIGLSRYCSVFIALGKGRVWQIGINPRYFRRVPL